MNIILFGYYGYRNVGDEQLLDETIRLIKEWYPLATISVASGPEPIPFQTFNRWNLWAWLCQLIRSRVVLFGGGSVFQSSSSFFSLCYYLLIIQFARLCRCRVLLLAQGWGPFKSHWHERFAKSILSTPMIVRSWRDRFSQTSFGSKEDPVFCDLVLLQKRPQPFQLNDGEAPLVGISVREKCDYKVLEALCLKKEYHTIQLVNQVVRRCVANEVLLEDVWDQPFNASMIVTDRYHTAIWASKFGIPWVAVSDDPKLQALAQDTLQPIISLSDRNLVDKLLEFVQSFPEPVRDQRLMDWYDSFKDQRHRVIGWLDEHLSN